MRIRLVYSAEGALRWAGHLDIAAELERWFARARVPLEYGRGFAKNPKFHYGPPKPTGVSSNWEVLDADISGLEPLAGFNFSPAEFGNDATQLDERKKAGQFPEARSRHAPDNEPQIPHFDFPKWWLDALPPNQAAGIENRTVRLAASLSANVAPGIALRGLRILEDGDKPATKLVREALFEMVFKFETGSAAGDFASRICSEKWIAGVSKSGESIDSKSLAFRIGTASQGEIAALFIRASYSPEATFPAMKIVKMLQENTGAVPLIVTREVLLGKDGLPVA